MRLNCLWFILVLSSCHLFAQEQLVLRLNEQGMLKILKLALDYNTGVQGSREIVIPENLYKLKIKKSQLNSNPIVPILNDISDLNLNHDLDFYFKTSDIKVSGQVDPKSLKTAISNAHTTGFDLRIDIAFEKISISGSHLKLCEDQSVDELDCGEGLKTTILDLQISTKNRPVKLATILRINTDGGVGRVTLLSVDSNLGKETTPDLDIDFRSLEVPKISIVIDGQETELDTSNLKTEILKRKKFLAQKLISFAGEFIAEDLAEMINKYLVNKEIATSYQIYRSDKNRTFNEFVTNSNGDYDTSEVSPVAFLDNPSALKERIFKYKESPIKVMEDQISEIIRNARVEVSLNKIEVHRNKDIELDGLFTFVLNNQAQPVQNTYGNSNRPLPDLDLSGAINNDINLAISEPVINSALDTVNNTGLFQKLLVAVSDVKGFSIRSVKSHFLDSKTIVAVINAEVDLKKLESAGVSSWIKNRIAAYLERNNNNAVIYFPIEVKLLPEFLSLPNSEVHMSVKIISPFKATDLPNNFNYPTNVPEMTKTVKNAVMAKLKESLEVYMDKSYNVDLNKFLNKSGVIFKPRKIEIHQSAYLLLNLDIEKIKFDSKSQN